MHIKQNLIKINTISLQYLITSKRKEKSSMKTIENEKTLSIKEENRLFCENASILEWFNWKEADDY